MRSLDPAVYTERDRRRWIEAGRQEGREEERAATLAYLRGYLGLAKEREAPEGEKDLLDCLIMDFEQGSHLDPP